MNQIVRAFPVKADRLADLHAFAAELKDRRADALKAFFGGYGVARETWHVQETEHGPWVIGVTEMHDEAAIPGVAERYAASKEEFDAWFKARVHELTGINLDEQPLGPPTRCILDSASL